MSSIDQEIETQTNLNWVQFWRENNEEITVDVTKSISYPHVFKGVIELIYKSAFKNGINEAFKQASLAAERELGDRGYG